MDAPRFDRFAKSLAAPRTRRGALTALATALSGAFALVSVPGAELPEALAGKKKKARGKRRKHKDDGVVVQGPCGDGDPKHNDCKRHGQCCTGYCRKKRCRCRRPGDPCTEDRNCCPDRTGATCQDGTCRAKAPTCAGQGQVCSSSVQCCAGFACDATGHCQPSSTCAEVGQNCSSAVRCCNEQQGVTCQNGICLVSEVCVNGCDDGIVCTDDTCDAAADACIHTPNHGRCPTGRICDPALGCVVGVERCDGIDNDGDGQVDEGSLCPGAPNATGACVSGTCQITCNAGFADCDGSLGNGCETSLLTDLRNCGGCGLVCRGCIFGIPPRCSGGVCSCG